TRSKRDWSSDVCSSDLSVLVSGRDRDHLAGHLVDLLLVVLDLLHPLPREPVLDASHDGVLPAEEVALGDEAVDEVEVVPRDADRDPIAALADRLDIRLDRLADQLGAVSVGRIALQERIDQLEVLFLEPKRNPLVFVHPRCLASPAEMGMT